MNNTINHVKDDAQYVKFDPTGNWPSNIKNVQAALAAIQGFAIAGLPTATEETAGIAEIATQKEVDDGLDGTKIVTPKTLAVKLSRPDATKLVKGITRYANNDEAMGDTPNIAIGPDTLTHVFEKKKATETVQGTIKICSMDAAKIGSDDTMAVTPKKMHAAIAQIVPGLIPEQNTASESREGLVRLATSQQTLAGTIREGFAVSPYAFSNARANENQAGTVKIASSQQMIDGNDNTVVVSAQKFANTKATTGQFGVVKLTDNPGSGEANAALSANARVLPLSGGVVTGDVYRHSGGDGNQFTTKNEMDAWCMPIGAIILTAFNSNDHGAFKICNGQWLNKHQYPTLFARIGFTYGGDGGDHFAVPDMRGLVARGCDWGRGLDPGRGFGTYQDDTMQHMTGNFPVANRWRGWTGGAFAITGGQWSTNYKNGGGDDWGSIVNFDSARQVRTSGETRVKSLALNYVIRVQ
ncbi:short tail fiber protein [Escherichia phage vB-Eco-KMB43]|nr:short tail fiber protein [Escherichia phage vB-Eco-KMB43]